MSGTVDIYTIWVGLKEDEGAWWMVAAEDEFSWEGNPDRCEAVFEKAKTQAEKDGYRWREITLKVPQDAIDAAFAPPQIEAEAAPA